MMLIRIYYSTSVRLLITTVLLALAASTNVSAQGLYRRLAAPAGTQNPSGREDADSDGIADALDQCPGTPANVAVNAHGCPLDRDGDGVPDYLDKQPMTPTECQPVDADGVGKCPCNCPGGDSAIRSVPPKQQPRNENH